MIKEYSSFTQRVKFEASNLDLGSNNENIAELNGFLNLSSKLVFANGKNFLMTSTILESTARRICAIVNDLFGKNVKIKISTKKESKNIRYIINIFSPKLWMDQIGLNFSNHNKLIKKVLKDKIAFSAFLRGLFLATGSINRPNTTFYHLEIYTHSKTKAKFIKEILNSFKDFKFKIVKRNSQYVLYAKKADNISDFLKLINTKNAFLYFENVRIERDFTNSIVRVNNMDIANLSKTIKASSKIVNMIKILKNQNNLDFLSQKAKKIIEIRIKYKNYTYRQIAKSYNEKNIDKITKSGVNHIMLKIKKAYEGKL